MSEERSGRGAEEAGGEELTEHYVHTHEAASRKDSERTRSFGWREPASAPCTRMEIRPDSDSNEFDVFSVSSFFRRGTQVFTG